MTMDPAAAALLHVAPRLAECAVLLGVGYQLRVSGIMTRADGEVIGWCSCRWPWERQIV
jgi:hypothetical protein